MSEGKPVYGWMCPSWDDESVECPFDSVEDALDDAQTRIEEDGPSRDWEYGTHDVEVEVMSMDEVCAFNAELAIDDSVQRLSDEGIDDADERLQLHAGARNRLVAELQAVWDAHVEREKVGKLWLASRRGTTHKISVTIEEDA